MLYVVAESSCTNTDWETGTLAVAPDVELTEMTVQSAPVREHNDSLIDLGGM